MRCHKCNQDSIKIDNGHILCNICGLDIDVSGPLEESLFDLFIYNKDLEDAWFAGRLAFSEDEKIGDNPYSTTSSELILNKRWEEGYNIEKNTYDLSALSFSSEKIENSLKTEIKELRKENRDLNKKIASFILDIQENNKDFCDKLEIWGWILRKHVEFFKKEYKRVFSSTWEE